MASSGQWCVLSFRDSSFPALTLLVPTVIIPEERVPALNRSIEQGFVKGGPPGQEGYIAGIEGETPTHGRDICRMTSDSYFSLPPPALPERASASFVGP